MSHEFQLITSSVSHQQLLTQEISNLTFDYTLVFDYSFLSIADVEPLRLIDVAQF